MNDKTVKDKPNLILYLIGHAPDAKYLKRLLSQVKPVVDAVAFVNTDDKKDCTEIVFNSGIEIVTIDQIEFKERTDFDFSKARNKSLALAENLAKEIKEDTGQDSLLMWLDCDDTIDAESLEAIGKAIRSQTADAFMINYNVGATSGNIRKIRIHRPGQWQWINKVHEEIRYKTENKPLVKMIEGASIKHDPDKEKSNHDFHISLLKESCRNAPNEYAYIGKEYFNRMMYDEALPWLLHTAAIHTWDNERYIAWIYAGYIMYQKKDLGKAEEYFRNAMEADPNRREAWFFLAQICVDKGGKYIRQALAYIAACNAQIDEKQPLQNEFIYNRDCYLLHAELLVAASFKQAAGQCLQKVKEAYRNEQWQKLAKQVGLTLEA